MSLVVPRAADVAPDKCVISDEPERSELPSLRHSMMGVVSATNVIKIFHFVIRFIVEQSGPDYPAAMQPFLLEAILQTQASQPLLVVAPNDCPRARVLEHFLRAKVRHENIEVVALTADLDIIRNTKRFIGITMNRATWMLVHVAKPSRAASAMLSDVLAQMGTASLNYSFRLVVIAARTEHFAGHSSRGRSGSG
jgi:hypothetical protein